MRPQWNKLEHVVANWKDKQTLGIRGLGIFRSKDPRLLYQARNLKTILEKATFIVKK
jgi:hypothetical protein